MLESKDECTGKFSNSSRGQQREKISRSYFEPEADFIVERYNVQRAYILDPVCYEYTLADWPGRKLDPFDFTYNRNGVMQTSDWVRKLIIRIFEVAFELHENHKLHGFLHHQEICDL